MPKSRPPPWIPKQWEVTIPSKFGKCNGMMQQILQTPIAMRDAKWHQQFFMELPKCNLEVIHPEPQNGPEGWPYLLTKVGGKEPAGQILSWLSSRGIGLVVNPTDIGADAVIPFGPIWNYRETGVLYQKLDVSAGRSPEAIQLKPGDQVRTGEVTAQLLPDYARKILKQFFVDQGVFQPKVLMVSLDGSRYDFSISVESLKSPPQHEHANIAEAIAWFLPAHFSVSLLSEKMIPGFQAL